MHPISAPDPLGHLPRDAYYHLVFTLRATMPPADGTPEALAWRDHAAIAQVASLCPVNAAEATLAAQFVAANAQAMDALRLARDPAITLEWVLRCSAQAAGMMRQAQAALRLLLRTQAERTKREGDGAAREQAAWTEHCATQWMAQALPGEPIQDASCEPEVLAAAIDSDLSQNTDHGLTEQRLETISAAAPPRQVSEPPPTPWHAPRVAESETGVPEATAPPGFSPALPHLQTAPIIP